MYAPYCASFVYESAIALPVPLPVRSRIRASAQARAVVEEAQRTTDDQSQIALATGMLIDSQDCTREQAEGLLRRAAEQEAALRELHRDLPHREGLWNRHLEGSYAVAGDLRTTDQLEAFIDGRLCTIAPTEAAFAAADAAFHSPKPAASFTNTRTRSSPPAARTTKSAWGSRTTSSR